MPSKRNTSRTDRASDSPELARLRDRCRTLPGSLKSSFTRRVSGLVRQRNRGRITRSVEALNREIDQLLAARAARAEVQLDIAYPDELPVSEARDEIIRALEENQVLIVCGETG